MCVSVCVCVLLHMYDTTEQCGACECIHASINEI